MVTRKENASGKRRRVKVGELKLHKETVRDLTSGEQKKIAGGRRGYEYDDDEENTCAAGNCNTVCNGPTLCNTCTIDGRGPC